MIVYADVLIFLNTLVDYFLLLVTAKFLRERILSIRIVIASIIGGVASLYILLPEVSSVAECLYKILLAFCMSAVCYGVSGVRRYLKNTGVLFLVTCAYAGIMFAFWIIFKPHGMVINNSIVYFNISPLVLVVCTSVGYVIFTMLFKIFKKSSDFAGICDITVFAEGKNIKLDAIIDTGNSIEDIFEKSEIIIADKKQIVSLLGGTDFEHNPKLKRRYRILPCNTVSGFDTLDSFRCDSAVISYQNKKIIIKKPLLAISKSELSDGYNAIINPKVLR